MEGFLFLESDDAPRVFVYRNLTNAVWSVRALNGPHTGKVVLHAVDVLLSDAQFKVSESGRQRVLLERQKNVHAGVVGTLVNATVVTERYAMTPTCRVNSNGPFCNGEFGAGDTEVTYNPYKYESFVYLDGTPVDNDEVEDVSLHSTFQVSVYDMRAALAA